MTLTHSFLCLRDMASLKYYGSPPSTSITYSYGGYLVEDRHSLVDLLNCGSNSGACSFGYACSISSVGLSLLSL